MYTYERALGLFLNFDEDLADHEIREKAHIVYKTLELDSTDCKVFHWEVMDRIKKTKEQRNDRINSLKSYVDSENLEEDESQIIEILKEINCLRRQLTYLRSMEEDIPKCELYDYLEEPL